MTIRKKFTNRVSKLLTGVYGYIVNNAKRKGNEMLDINRLRGAIYTKHTNVTEFATSLGLDAAKGLHDSARQTAAGERG